MKKDWEEELREAYHCDQMLRSRNRKAESRDMGYIRRDKCWKKRQKILDKSCRLWTLLLVQVRDPQEKKCHWQRT